MGIITLENQNLKVEIKSKGAELSSLLDKADGLEHMWRADPQFWPRKAPILFPCVGESKEGRINVDGTDYPMGRHGFARHEPFSVLESTNTKVVLELKTTEKTRAQFPFEFVFRVSYELIDSSLTQSFEVTNTDGKEIGFQLGGHPAFAVPFNLDEKYDDYEFVFDAPQTLERHLLTDKGLYSGMTRPFLKTDDRFGLSYNLFEEDALVFKNISSKQVWIQHKNGGKRLQVDYAGFPHLGIWSIPGANYVCIEPWIGCADSIDQPNNFFLKDSLVKLETEKSFEASFIISIHPE